ncbi:MAG: two-component sensor histidine kinase [Candidatus Latescibacterota bacterium]|jgi:two-component sensor histidine kinase
MQSTSTSSLSQNDSDLDTALDAVVRHSLTTISLGLGLLYILLACIHYVVLPAAIYAVICPVALVTATFFLALRWALGHWKPSSAWAHPLGTVIALITLGNSLLHLYMLDDPGQTTNQILIIIGVAYLLLSIRYFLFVTAIVWLGWSAVALQATPAPEWQHYGFALLSATMLGIVIHLVRTRTIRRLEQLRLQNERYNEELEERVAERTAALQNLLDEKEVLLREVHHRVKNNLQVVCSLLDLQVHASSDLVLLTPLIESRGRILAMALVHEKLYQSDHLNQIDMSSYLEHLVTDVFNASGEWPGHITLKIDAEELELDIDRAIPCGLVLHELVSNALRHAYPNKSPGHLLIQMRQIEGQMELQVVDDGIGLPEDFNLSQATSLGLQLTRGLAAQLLGRIEVDANNQTCFKLTFPL